MHAIFTIAALLIAFALVLVVRARQRRRPQRRRTSHKYIPACYSQPLPEIENQHQLKDGK